MTAQEEYKILEEQHQKLLKQYIDIAKKVYFVKGYEATDQEALGLIISHYFEWNGIRIMETFANSLEDANFHTQCEVVRDWIETYKLSK